MRGRGEGVLLEAEREWEGDYSNKIYIPLNDASIAAVSQCLRTVLHAPGVSQRQLDVFNFILSLSLLFVDFL